MDPPVALFSILKHQFFHFWDTWNHSQQGQANDGLQTKSPTQLNNSSHFKGLYKQQKCKGDPRGKLRYLLSDLL